MPTNGLQAAPSAPCFLALIGDEEGSANGTEKEMAIAIAKESLASPLLPSAEAEETSILTSISSVSVKASESRIACVIVIVT